MWHGDCWTYMVERETQAIVKEDKNLRVLKYYCLSPLSFSLLVKYYIISYLKTFTLNKIETCNN